MKHILLDPYQLRGLSLNRLARMRLRILVKFLAKALLHPRARARRLSRLRLLGRSRQAPEAIVLGLGPTLARLDSNKVTRLQAAGALEVFAVNAYFRTDFANEIIPDYYVMTDPAYFSTRTEHYQSTSRADPEKAWKYLENHEDIRIVIPDDRSAPLTIDPARVFFVNSLGLEGFVRNIHPARPRGYLAITAYTALAIAVYLDFERIYILGIENSQFRSLALTPGGRIGFRGHHVYSSDQPDIREVAIWRAGGVAAYFEDVSRLFADLHLFAHAPIVNLDRDSLVDAFPIADHSARSTLLTEV